jgi:hypothetical protein
MSTIINATTTNGVVIQPDNSGSLVLQTNSGTTALTIDTSQRAAFVAGTAALPAITTAGDTNTGMFFPAADTIAFAEGGTEAMRLDSSGNVGIGVTPSAWGSSYKAQQIGQAGTIAGHTGVPAMTLVSNAYENSGWKAITTSPAHRIDLSSDNNATIFYRAASVTAGSALSFAESMRIDSSGNVLVGTTSGGSGRLRVSGGGDAFATSYTSPSAGYFFSSNSADTTCVEIYQGRYNRAGLALSANNSGTVTQIDFYQTGTSRGSISTNNSTTAYNTSSDYRLKENIVPMTGALATVQALKPVTYTWKADGSDGQGFIAHELQEIVPNAVTGEKDAVETYTDEDGIEQTRIKPQGIDTSFLVATLTAAIQELKAIVDAQAIRIETLEAK